ncbi:MLO protein homolog 1-like protein [Tanacetum coccineum]
MIQPEIAESAEIAKSAEIAESAEITERTEDSMECRKFRNSINVIVISKTDMGDFQLFTTKVVSKNFADENIITEDSYQGQLLLFGELINILALRLNKEVDDKDTQEFWMEVSLLSSMKKLEAKTTSLEYEFANDPARFRFAHHTSFVKRHTGLSTKPGIRCVNRYLLQTILRINIEG